MKVLVCGSTGCVGRAVVRALRARDHQVIEGARSLQDGRHSLHVDYMQPRPPQAWARLLSERRVDAVVNCIGVLMPARGQSFERVHSRGPIELFQGAARAGVARVVQVSALGVGAGAASLSRPYLHSKLLADDVLATLPLQWAVLRPSLVYGPHSQSADLFATLASLPVIALPGRGEQLVQPIHVYELAEVAVRLLEQESPLHGVFELGGPQAMRYRTMLSQHRAALGLGPALWLPLPMPLMALGAWCAEALPQRVFCRDTIAMLQAGSVPRVNASAALLGRLPTSLAQGLATTPARPLVDLDVRMSAAVSLALRAALACMWIVTALVSAALPRESGVMQLLARCGFEGSAGVAMLALSCALNLALGLCVLWRPRHWVHALQVAAVVGYTGTAAWFMPELTIDHCGPLLKNLPVLAAVLLLWMARPDAAPAAARADATAAPGPRSVAGSWDRGIAPSR